MKNPSTPRHLGTSTPALPAHWPLWLLIVLFALPAARFAPTRAEGQGPIAAVGSCTGDVNGDRFEDCPETAIYVDPPYPKETRSNLSVNAGGGGRYEHEFSHDGTGLFPDDDHSRLAKMLRDYKHARIVVSTYDCPRYRQLYDGWTFIDCTMQKNLHAMNKRGAAKKEAPEVLIVNGPEIKG